MFREGVTASYTSGICQRNISQWKTAALTVSYSPTVILQEHSFMAETDKSQRSVLHIHLFVYEKATFGNTLGTTTYTTGYNFRFFTHVHHVPNTFHSLPGGPHLHFASN